MVIDTEIECSTFTVAEAAKILGLSVGKTYEALNQRQIPARRVGAKWIISRQVLYDWLNFKDKK